MPDADNFIKQREIGFRGPHPDSDQGGSAELMLNDAHGVLEAKKVSNRAVMVRYDLRLVHFAAIEKALQETGFHLDNNLMYKLRRAMITYSEDIQLEDLGISGISCSQNCAQQVFIEHYRKRQHGCRDQRPQHWREYH